ncbi:NAD-dependent epimerase/dehydratase [Heterosigma akashiwo virus 01]|uniref:NAD-dependent epimerase/dehydratase n=1 Tax=Heterosigma akashiwo virus 01 TaxID=97195 RepID=A0A1C9C5J0_HAV01|nr:nucleotide-sugar epimerase [Heterosigma akashiwo virus 01]AOM63553.1 NAD-dependent epimerase/dehydratase [Heterosigma akashiwo virus 01]
MVKKICVIGYGYIGSAIVDYILNESDGSYNLTIIDMVKKVNIPDNVVFWKGDYTMYDYSLFDVIILTAGQASVKSGHDISETMENNVENFTKILKNLDPEQIFIYSSSSSVYGKTDCNIVNEEYSVYHPHNAYDFSKQCIDILAQMNTNACFYGLRYGTVNGFSRCFRKDLIINSMYVSAKRDNIINVYNKDTHRPILDIKDLCAAVYTIMENGTYEQRGLYNLASFNSTVAEIANVVSNKTGAKIEFHDNVSITEGKTNTKSYDFSIDFSKFCSTFNFTFNGTIDSVVDHIQTEFPNIEYFSDGQFNYRDYRIRDCCKVCGSITLKLTMDLGEQPLANSYHDKTEILRKYPLRLFTCKNCFHMQLDCEVYPDILFKNYHYLSGTSGTLKSYFDYFASDTVKLFEEKHDLKALNVLDIACNDGSQLDSFKGMNLFTVGVDHAKNIKRDDHEHHIIQEYFNYDTVSELLSFYNYFDIIIAQNVFARISDIHNFLYNIRRLMNIKSILRIQTSQCNMVHNNEFDTVYHEHLSFFNINSMEKACLMNDMVLTNVTKTDIHGTSYVFDIALFKHETDANIDDLKDCENSLYDINTYDEYSLNCIKYRNELHNALIEQKLSGKKLIGFGSTAKSNTLLNSMNISSDFFTCIIDENKLKQGKYTPGTDILVCSLDDISQEDVQDSIFVILAWNFYEEIKNKLKERFDNCIVMNIYPLFIE